MRLRVLALAGAGAVAWASMITPAYAADGVKLSVLHGGSRSHGRCLRRRQAHAGRLQAGHARRPAGSQGRQPTRSPSPQPTPTDDSDPAIGPVELTLEDGGNYTAVAHLEEGGDPTATLFTNDTSRTDAGQGRLTVRHTAAAPAVDILAGGDAVISDLSNPDEKVLDLDAGTIEASVAAAGTTDPVIGPADVTVSEGKNTIVYAWGSLDDDNLDLAVQTISGLHSSPDGVGAGEAGLAADSSLPGLAAWRPRSSSAAWCWFGSRTRAAPGPVGSSSPDRQAT